MTWLRRLLHARYPLYMEWIYMLFFISICIPPDVIVSLGLKTKKNPWSEGVFPMTCLVSLVSLAASFSPQSRWHGHFATLGRETDPITLVKSSANPETTKPPSLSTQRLCKLALRALLAMLLILSPLSNRAQTERREEQVSSRHG